MLSDGSAGPSDVPPLAPWHGCIVGLRAQFEREALPDVARIAPAIAAALGWDDHELFAGDQRGKIGELWVIGVPSSAGSEAPEVAARVGAELIGAAASLVAFSASVLSIRTNHASQAVTHTMPVALAVPTSEASELDRYYEEEHTPALLATQGWKAVRRYEIDKGTVAIRGAAKTSSVGPAWTRLALHDLVDGAAMRDAGVAATMTTPWYLALDQRPWFHEGGSRPLPRL